jgi:hypothetical protein
MREPGPWGFSKEYISIAGISNIFIEEEAQLEPSEPIVFWTVQR